MNNMSFKEYMDAMHRKDKRVRKQTEHEMHATIYVEFVDVWGNVLDWELFDDYFEYCFYDFYKYFFEKYDRFTFDDFYDYDVEVMKYSSNERRITLRILRLGGVA